MVEEETEKEFRERWEENGGTWTKNGTADMAKLRVSGVSEGEYIHVLGAKEIKRSDAKKVERGNFGRNEGKIERMDYEASSV